MAIFNIDYGVKSKANGVKSKANGFKSKANGVSVMYLI
jgi:hypothetical protein